MEQALFDFISKYVVLSKEEKNAIFELNLFRSIKKGTVLLKEGQRSNVGYFVLKGCLRTFYVIDGEEKTTAFYTEMQGVTPHCVTTQKPSKYYISAVEDSIITVGTSEMEVECPNAQVSGCKVMKS